MIREACVETLDEAILAEKQGADRLELCSDLKDDGLTPDLDLLKQVLRTVNIPIKVMIRPRPGNFVYSEQEVKDMFQSIKLMKELGISGFVFGALRENREMDLDLIYRLSKIASPIHCTIHKAIDETPDILRSTEDLMKLETIHSILTSGGAETAIEGQDLIKEMINLAGESIEIIAAGKIRSNNLDHVHSLIGAKAYHGRKIVFE
jgi:copper homeostasis protein